MRHDTYETVKVDAPLPPSQVEPGKLYDTGKWAQHRCMCGCGAYLSIPIAPAHSNRWDAKRESGHLSLSPSLLNRPCGAHYFLEEGKVRWC